MKLGCEHWCDGREPEWIARLDDVPILACPICNPTGVHLLRAEILFLYAFVFALRPKFVVEIGSAYGGSACTIAQAMIDAGCPPTPQTMFLIDSHPQLTAKNKAFLSDRCTLIEQKSPGALERLPMETADFVFLDGDHAAEAVLDDLRGLYGHMKPGGYILCHDALNEQTNLGLMGGAAATGLIDCGMVATTPQLYGPDSWGGLRLLRRG